VISDEERAGNVLGGEETRWIRMNIAVRLLRENRGWEAT